MNRDGWLKLAAALNDQARVALAENPPELTAGYVFAGLCHAIITADEKGAFKPENTDGR